VVEERVERRLAAILCADVAGYSRLMGADEEGTFAVLKSDWRELIDPLIAQHRGRIFKTTGDGLLIEFASVVDAVRCAVVVQQGMEDRNANRSETERIRFRIGINLGDVIHDEGDIFGDGVNVAARLQTLAEPAIADGVSQALPLWSVRSPSSQISRSRIAMRPCATRSYLCGQADAKRTVRRRSAMPAPRFSMAATMPRHWPKPDSSSLRSSTTAQPPVKPSRQRSCSARFGPYIFHGVGSARLGVRGGPRDRVGGEGTAAQPVRPLEL
jgi:hypothetical protein